MRNKIKTIKYLYQYQEEAPQDHLYMFAGSFTTSFIRVIPFVIKIGEVCFYSSYVLHSQPIHRRHKNVLKTSYFWSQRRLRLVSNGSHDDIFLRRLEDVFQETYARPLPGDVLKTLPETSSRPLSGDVLKTSKISSRLFW